MKKIIKSDIIPKTLQNAPVPTNVKQVDKDIYRADDVCKQLLEDQHYQCAYCECRITKEYNDVEHYRPKSIYYWLGHNWKNLLYACDFCNRTCKNDLFPLKDESKRVTVPGNLEEEEPLILNPTSEDPTAHIRYNRHMLIGITDQGRTTIDLFKLNQRPVLVHDREQLFELYHRELSTLKNVRKLLESPDLPPESRAILVEISNLSSASIEQYKSKDTPYSGMLVNQ